MTLGIDHLDCLCSLNITLSIRLFGLTKTQEEIRPAAHEKLLAESFISQPDWMDVSIPTETVVKSLAVRHSPLGTHGAKSSRVPSLDTSAKTDGEVKRSLGAPQTDCRKSSRADIVSLLVLCCNSGPGA